MSDQFIQVPLQMLQDSSLSVAACVVWAYLRFRQGANGDCWPSMATIASDIGLCQKTVQRSVEQLSNRGYLNCQYPKKPGPGHTIRYQTKVDKLTTSYPKKGGQNDHRVVDTLSKSGGQNDRVKEQGKRTVLLHPSEITFPLKDGTQWQLPEGKTAEYQTTFPDLNIESELRKAWQWLEDNPAKRKTAGHMLGFINGWLGRAKPSAPEPAALPVVRDADGLTLRDREIRERGIRI